MTAITSATDSLLRKEFIEATMMNMLNPTLQFYGLARPVDLGGATTFRSFEDMKSSELKLKDGETSAPVELSESARIPEMGMTKIDTRIDDTTRYGFALRFSKDIVRRENDLINPMRILLNDAGYNMKRQLNLDIMNTIKSFAGASQITLNDGSWTTSNKITEDIRDMQKAFDLIEYDFKLTDMYTYKDAYWGVTKFCDALGNDLTPENLKGVALYEDDFMTEGLLGLDTNANPLTMYYNTEPELSSLENSFINVNIIEEERHPRDTIVEITMEYGIGVNHPKAMLYQPNI
ncbi:MAG: hypothetical protein HUJ56_11675 [Erysipelotrichaceae bacterium]|nr:hypothetical protein [Erysipelotrichaceae bacterium]